VVTGPEDLLDNIIVSTSGDELTVRTRVGFNVSTRDILVQIYTKDFSSITASSSARVVVKDRFTQDRMKIQVSSSGSVKGDLEANDFTISASSSGSFSGRIWAVDFGADVSSSGTISINGKSKNAKMQASSSGSIRADKVEIKNLNAQASSSGNIEASVSDEVRATANSAGGITFTKIGDLPVREVQSNSAGTVRIR